MLSLVAALVLLAPEVPPECQAPPTREVSSLSGFAQSSGSLSVGLDSVATWCFDSGGTWTGGNQPSKNKKAAGTEPTADCAKAILSCEAAKASISPESRQVLFDALGDIERPFLGVKYKPKRSGLAERPPEVATCTARERSTLFGQAQARMDLARLASQVQSEYANYKTWLFSEGLKCAQAVARGEKDYTRRGIAVDTPTPGGGTQQVPVSPDKGGGATVSVDQGANRPGGTAAGASNGTGGPGTAGVANSGVKGSTQGAAGATAGTGVNGGATAGSGVNGGATAGSGVNNGATAGSGVNGGATAGSGVNGGATVGSGVNKGATAGLGVNNGATAGSGVNGGATAGSGVNGGATAASGLNNGGATAGSGVNSGATAGSGVNGGGSTAGGAKAGSGANGSATAGSGVNDGATAGSGVNNGATAGSGVNNGATAGSGVNAGATAGSGVNGGATGTGLNGGATAGSGVNGGATGTGGALAAGTTNAGARAPGSAGSNSPGATIPLGGPTAERERALASSMLDKWRYFFAEQHKIEQDPDWVGGFLSSRELRDCRCTQRPIPGEIVRRLESKDRVPQLEADDDKNTRCELCLLDAYPPWKARAQKQCALALELSEFELGYLQRSDDGNGLPPRCVDAAKAKLSGKPATSVAGPLTQQPQQGKGGAAFIITRAPDAPPPAQGDFVKPSDYAPMPSREDGRVYVRVFTSAACVAEILPGPIQARTGDLLPVPTSARDVTVRGPCGGFVELYFGKEEKPRVSDSFARNQPLRIQLRP